jgi:hypothetical protein
MKINEKREDIYNDTRADIPVLFVVGKMLVKQSTLASPG